MLNELYQSLDPIAFTLGPVSVRWYGLAYLVGFIAVGVIVYFTARRWKLDFDEDDLLTFVLAIMIGVIVGARLGYVVFYGEGLSYYLANPLKVIAVNEGGMSFHGGLAGAMVGGFVSSKILGISFLTMADLGAIAAPVGLFLGRCANFVNGELWGAPTDFPWGVVFGGAAGMMPRHPSQLYEALLEGVVIFVVLMALSRKVPARPRGTFLGLFLVMYGCFRFMIEFIRQPDVQLGYLAGDWLTMGQVLSIPLVLLGIALLVYALRWKVPQTQPISRLSAGRKSAKERK